MIPPQFTVGCPNKTADGAVEGGRTLEGEMTFVCRAVYEDLERNKTVVLPGTLVPSEGTCNVPYAGPKKLKHYGILVDAGCSCDSYVDFFDDSMTEDVEIFHLYNRTIGVQPFAHSHGYVHCISMVLNAEENYNTSGYISITDYVFTGLDGEIYLFSKGFPNNS
ncbi:unnamed protein product, partial [Allacma fusca]